MLKHGWDEEQALAYIVKTVDPLEESDAEDNKEIETEAEDGEAMTHKPRLLGTATAAPPPLQARGQQENAKWIQVPIKYKKWQATSIVKPVGALATALQGLDSIQAIKCRFGGPCDDF